MKAGIIGCGFIGSEVAKFIDEDKNFRLIGMNDIDKSRFKILIKKLKHNRPKFMELDKLIENCDLIIESAAKNIIKRILSDKTLDKENKILLIMSASGLINNLNLLNKIKKCKVLLPSGAICGLDAIKAVSGKIKSLTLTTTKPIKGLEGASYIIKNNIELKNLKNKKIIFEGKLNDAVSGFPQNINVAATLFLASKFNNIKVKIAADPKTKFNSHEIEAIGDFGIIKTTTNNLPSKNPRTSFLAVLSAIDTIKNIKNNIKIGN